METAKKTYPMTHGAHAWNPATDAALFKTYTIASLTEKKKNKEAFQKLTGLSVRPRIPLVAIIPSFTAGQGMGHIESMFTGLVQNGCQIAIVDETISKKFDAQMSHCRDLCTSIHGDERTLHRVLAASDMVILPARSVPQGVLQHIALRYGTVPIARIDDRADDLLQDYDPRTETGNSFLYYPDSVWSMFASFVRAAETYKLPFDWRSIQRNGMELTGSELEDDADDTIET